MSDDILPNTLSQSDIARMVGMRPSAVTNWRKRPQKGFPEPVATKGGFPRFDYDQVTQWLRGQSISFKDTRLEQGAWTFLEQWRDGGDPVAAAAVMLWAMCLRAVAGEYGVDARWQAVCDTVAEQSDDHGGHVGRRIDAAVEQVLEGASCGVGSQHASEVIRMALRVPNEVRPLALSRLSELLMYVDGLYKIGTPEAFAQLASALLERSITSLGRMRGESGVPGSRVSRLLADLALAYWRAAAPGKAGVTVYDPACGIMESCLSLARGMGDGERRRLAMYCADDDGEALTIAARRLTLEGLARNAVFAMADDGKLVNVLEADPFPRLKADLAMVEPPLAVDWEPDVTDVRWNRYSDSRRWSSPMKADASVAWIQDAIGHLNDMGRAFIVTGAGVLSHMGGEEWFRRSLIEAGCVEAVIALPANLYVTTVAPRYVWVLSAPQAARECIMMVDASGNAERYRSQGEIPEYLHEPLEAFVGDGGRGAGRGGRAGGGCGIAVRVVPASEVLESRIASLLPQDWLERKVPELAAVEASYRSVASDIEGMKERVSAALETLRKFDDAPWNGKGGELRRLGDIADIRQGSVAGAEKDGLPEDVIRVSDVRGYDAIQGDGSRGRAVPWGVAPDRIVTRPSLHAEERYGKATVTEPGDLLLTIGGGIHVAIDWSGGHRVSKSVYLVRPYWGIDVQRATYLSLMIRGVWNQEMVEHSAGKRMRPADLEIPLMHGDAEWALVDYWNAAETLRRQANLYLRQYDIMAQCCRYGLSVGGNEGE
ncbi:HsdM family class I SAM-dependent methyltransferase [Bifidobacterium leontopitheci]|uniref:N-6 DNA Methylase n=1 Tax=Bifidobacterium leontopitheci TaxID=2650774 RepID=A0A6I1GG52_9BIFI|nr:N-6 DNA methylase [Bifidobacterium leontopitheci]KAB7789672.1 N-6 DNA Methylase [Bifidobacterium leontopitheci]